MLMPASVMALVATLMAMVSVTDTPDTLITSMAVASLGKTFHELSVILCNIITSLIARGTLTLMPKPMLMPAVSTMDLATLIVLAMVYAMDTDSDTDSLAMASAILAEGLNPSTFSSSPIAVEASQATKIKWKKEYLKNVQTAKEICVHQREEEEHSILMMTDASNAFLTKLKPFEAIFQSNKCAADSKFSMNLTLTSLLRDL